MHKDYYKILDINRDASEADIKKAFRAKAKEYHSEFNNSSEAEANFVLVNEAYDILTHKKTREILDGPSPEHFPSYQHWLQVARERAVIHSRLPYSEFVRTKFYHSTKTAPYLMYLFNLLVGIIAIVASLLVLFIFEDNAVIGVILFLACLPVGIFLIVIGLGGLSGMKKYKKERKKEMKKAEKLA